MLTIRVLVNLDIINLNEILRNRRIDIFSLDISGVDFTADARVWNAERRT